MLDLSKLTPAPWNDNGFFDHAKGQRNKAQCVWIEENPDQPDILIADSFPESNRDLCPDEDTRDVNMQFIALARNAFDVMMRRGWYALQDSEKWIVAGEGTGILWANKGYPKVIAEQPAWSDPFTALVEAEKWYVENVEEKPR